MCGGRGWSKVSHSLGVVALSGLQRCSGDLESDWGVRIRHRSSRWPVVRLSAHIGGHLDWV